MGKLRGRAEAGGKVFAPFVFRLALKLEQVPWTEAAASASETIFVLRSAQRLFKLDAVCSTFDTWLEAEAVGGKIDRDEYGRVRGCPERPVALPPLGDALKTEPVSRSVEITRRLALDAGSGALPLAGLSIGATLISRLGTAANGSGPNGASGEVVEYAHQLALGLAKAHLEAGAVGLVLIHEEDSPDLIELPGFAPVFNLAAYFDAPVIFVSGHPLSARGLETFAGLGGALYVTPNDIGGGIDAFFEEGGTRGPGSRAWLCCSRWEIDPDTDPDAIHAWRRRVMSA